jgi:hypothetical protein
MKLKFWQRQTADAKAPRPSKPREIPDAIGRYLVVTLKHEPDWVWQLMFVSRQRNESAGGSDIVIYDPQQANQLGVHVTGYHSLAQQPSLILFEGWFDKGRGTFEIRPTEHLSPRPTAA